MANADEQRYEEVITYMRIFSGKVMECCFQMNEAVQVCIDNMDGDLAAQKNCEKLWECLKQINAGREQVLQIAKALYIETIRLDNNK